MPADQRTDRDHDAQLDKGARPPTAGSQAPPEAVPPAPAAPSSAPDEQAVRAVSASRATLTARVVVRMVVLPEVGEGEVGAWGSRVRVRGVT